MTREMTPEEADDHWSEHGDMTPAEVAAAEEACRCGCPACPQCAE